MAVAAVPGTSIDTTVVSVRPQPAANGSCDLCARPPGELAAVVQVQQTGGATTFLRSCAYCARALRRIGAVSRGLIRLVDGEAGPQTVGPEIGLTGELLRRAEVILDYNEASSRATWRTACGPWALGGTTARGWDGWSSPIRPQGWCDVPTGRRRSPTA